MLDVFVHALSAIIVLLSMIGLGYYICAKGWCDTESKNVLAKIVNFSIPFFLFYSIISKFDHAQLMEILRLSLLPFLIVGANYAVSLLLVRFGAVRQELAGTFVATFTGATTMFVGVPVILSMYGDKGLPYLLVYFFANVTFVWSLGLYHIQLDGIHKEGKPNPPILTAKSLKMIFSKPILGFFAGVFVILVNLPVPETVTSITKMFAHIVSPLALIFVGTTIYFVGFGKFRNMQREHWLVLFSCSILRPLLTYLCALPFDIDPYAVQVLAISSAMPVTSVDAVLAKVHNGAAEFASEVVGLSTVAFIFALPILLLAVNMI